MKIEGTDIEKKIMPLYLQGKTIQEIADEFCIKSNYKLVNAIEVYINLSNNPKELHKKRIQSILDYNVYSLYKQGMSYAQIGKKYNISGTDVKNKLMDYCKINGIIFNDIINQKDRPSFENKSDNGKKEFINKLAEEYKNGKTIGELAEKYNYSVYTISKRLKEGLSLEEYERISEKNRKIKLYFTDKEIEDIVNLYESGTINKSEIAKEYHVSRVVIERLLLKEYQKRGFNYIPSVVSKKTFLNILDKNNYTKEQMIKIATNAKKVIPPQYFEDYFEKNVNIDKIRKYVINQYTSDKQDEVVDETLKNGMFKSFNIATILKNNGLTYEYQAVAILYLLPQLTGVTIEELKKVVEGNEDIIKSIEALNLDTTEELYIQNLQNYNIALRVKIAEKIDEIKQALLEDKPINLAQYSRYYELAKETELIKEFGEVKKDNIRLFKIKEGEEH